MRCDILVAICHCCGNLLAVLQLYGNAVGDLQTRGLAEVLDTVDKFACDTFFDECRSEFNIKGDGDSAIVCYELTWHIFGDDLYILCHKGVVAECEGARGFKGGNIVLGHLCNSGS